jgi:1,2-phenylacetyl-CoA epoxidase PaaB subunit
VLLPPQPSPSSSSDHNPKVPSQILISLGTKALSVHVPNHMCTCMFCPHVYVFISTQQSTQVGIWQVAPKSKCTKMPCERMTPEILHQKKTLLRSKEYIYLWKRWQKLEKKAPDPLIYC